MTDKLTDQDIKRAINMLRANANVPYLLAISSCLEIDELLNISVDARSFAYGGGFIPYKNSAVPQDMLRFEMSDGTYKEFPIKNEVTYLPR